MYGVENEAGVYFARKGYYKGKEVTATHRNGDEVWLEDYPVGKDPIEYGIWVKNEAVAYTAAPDLPPIKQKPKRQRKNNK